MVFKNLWPFYFPNILMEIHKMRPITTYNNAKIPKTTLLMGKELLPLGLPAIQLLIPGQFNFVVFYDYLNVSVIKL